MLADLVEEERAALGRREVARVALLRAGERALLVPEELGLEQRLGQRRAVQLDQRAGGDRARVVDPAGDLALAGPALAEQQHGGRGPRDPHRRLERGRASPGSRRPGWASAARPGPRIGGGWRAARRAASPGPGARPSRRAWTGSRPRRASSPPPRSRCSRARSSAPRPAGPPASPPRRGPPAHPRRASGGRSPPRPWRSCPWPRAPPCRPRRAGRSGRPARASRRRASPASARRPPRGCLPSAVPPGPAPAAARCETSPPDRWRGAPGCLRGARRCGDSLPAPARCRPRGSWRRARRAADGWPREFPAHRRRRPGGRGAPSAAAWNCTRCAPARAALVTRLRNTCRSRPPSPWTWSPGPALTSMSSPVAARAGAGGLVEERGDLEVRRRRAAGRWRGRGSRRSGSRSRSTSPRMSSSASMSRSASRPRPRSCISSTVPLMTVQGVPAPRGPPSPRAAPRPRPGPPGSRARSAASRRLPSPRPPAR